MNIFNKKINALLIVVALFVFAACLQSINVHALTTIVLQKTEPNTHSFTNLPLTNDGWTDFRRMIKDQDGYKNARVVFVSSSEGNDATGKIYGVDDITFDADGMFQAIGSVNAFQSRAEGAAQIRSGYPDLLLFKRGDEWAGGLGTWSKSGPSPSRRMIISSYGTGDRPTFNIGASNGISASNSQNLIVSGLHFRSLVEEFNTSLRGDGIYLQGGAFADQLYEDCFFNWTSQFIAQGGNTLGQRVALRRSVANETRTFYATNMVGLLLEENIFSKIMHQEEPSISSTRQMYLSPSSNPETGEHDSLRGVIVRGNILYAGDTNARSGGVLENNLFLREDQVFLGGAGGSTDSIQSGTVRYNVWIERDPSATSSAAGIFVRNNDGTEINDNIFTYVPGVTHSIRAIQLAGDANVHIMKNVNIYNNIFYNHSGTGTNRVLEIGSTFTEIENVNIYDNDFQLTINQSISDIILHRTWDGGTKRFEGYNYSGNRYWSDDTPSKWFTPGGDFKGWVVESGETDAQAIKVNYPDPDRTVGTYNVLHGGDESTNSFINEALRQSRYNWRPEYTACRVNNYIRAGFGKETLDCDLK